MLAELTLSSWLKKATSSLLALPLTGGADTLTRNTLLLKPTTSFLAAPG